MPPYVHTAPYIWTPPYVQRVLIGYLFSYIIKCFPTLEGGMGLSDLGDVHMPPIFICSIHLDAPYVWMPPYVWAPLYVWMPPVCLNTPICLDTPILLDAPYIWGHPNIQGASKHTGVPKHMGHENIWRCPNTERATNIWGHLNI